jgi:hypothetical protein
LPGLADRRALHKRDAFGLGRSGNRTIHPRSTRRRRGGSRRVLRPADSSLRSTACDTTTLEYRRASPAGQAPPPQMPGMGAFHRGSRFQTGGRSPWIPRSITF